jgi:epoxyqueuosine reductase QueG
MTIEEGIKKLALEMGIDAVGIASVAEINKIAPEGHRPDDILRGAKSVVVMGKLRYSKGQWMSSNLDAIHRGRGGQGGRDAAGTSVMGFIEKEYGNPSLMISPGMFETGMVPVLSLKLMAELAGLGQRCMAGGIILNKKFGLMGFVAVVTTLDLIADGPVSEPACPHPSCVTKYENTGETPCMESCRAIDGVIENGRLKEVKYYQQLCATRALTTMNAAYLRLLPEIMNIEDQEKRKHLAIGQARKFIEDPPGRGIWGRCIECMRVCPVNRQNYREKELPRK